MGTAAKKEEDTYFSPRELSSRWEGRIATKTLANWRTLGIGPRFRRFGNKIMYRLDWVKKYEADHDYLTTRDYGKKAA